MIYLATNNFNLNKCQEILKNLGFVPNIKPNSSSALKIKLLELKHLKPCVSKELVQKRAQDRLCIFTSAFCASEFAHSAMSTIAVGQSTAKALTHTKLLASAKEQNAASMIDLIKQNFASERFIYLRAKKASCDVAKQLRDCGIDCNDLVCYESIDSLKLSAIEFIKSDQIPTSAAQTLCLISSASLARALYLRLVKRDYLFKSALFCAKKPAKVGRFKARQIAATAVCIGTSSKDCAAELFTHSCLSQNSSLNSLILKALELCDMT